MADADIIKVWQHRKLTCILWRHPRLKHFCGYVEVPQGHLLHKSEYEEFCDILGFEPHGGISYWGQLIELDVSVVEHDMWFIGFDYVADDEICEGQRLRFGKSFTIRKVWRQDEAVFEIEMLARAVDLAGRKKR